MQSGEMCFVRDGVLALVITFARSWELSVSPCTLKMLKRPCSGLKILLALSFNSLVERIIFPLFCFQP